VCVLLVIQMNGGWGVGGGGGGWAVLESNGWGGGGGGVSSCSMLHIDPALSGVFLPDR
jgi:hypothetical protein